LNVTRIFRSSCPGTFNPHFSPRNLIVCKAFRATPLEGPDAGSAIHQDIGISVGKEAELMYRIGYQ
jgi:hypothetical protein